MFVTELAEVLAREIVPFDQSRARGGRRAATKRHLGAEIERQIAQRPHRVEVGESLRAGSGGGRGERDRACAGVDGGPERAGADRRAARGGV